MSQQINLLDARLRRQQRHFSAAAVLAGLGAVLALAVVFQQLYAWQNRSLQAALAQMDARAAPLREQLVRFAKEFGGQGSSAALNDEIARVEEALRRAERMGPALPEGSAAALPFTGRLIDRMGFRLPALISG